jgi:hypothetical protein
MTVASNNDGTPVSWLKKITSTSDFVIATATSDVGFRLDSLRAACDGTATTFTFWVDDGAGNAVNIINAKQVAANSYEDVKDHSLVITRGQSFKCKAGAANHIDVTVALIQTTSKKPTTT